MEPWVHQHTETKKRGGTDGDSVCVCVCVLSQFNCVRLFANPWTLAHKAPLCMGFSRQEYWSGLPFPSPGDLPNSRIEPISHVSCIGRQVLYH